MRVATTVKKEDGSSAVGTPLATNSPALAKLNNGEPYYGDATVFGKAYDAGYEPIGKRDKVRRDDRRSPKDCYGSEKPVCRAHSLARSLCWGEFSRPQVDAEPALCHRPSVEIDGQQIIGCIECNAERRCAVHAIEDNCTGNAQPRNGGAEDVS